MAHPHQAPHRTATNERDAFSGAVLVEPLPTPVSSTDARSTTDEGTMAPAPTPPRLRALDVDPGSVYGLERQTRLIAGLLIGSFGLIGVVAARNPVLGVTLGSVALLAVGHLLAVGKTEIDPVGSPSVARGEGAS